MYVSFILQDKMIEIKYLSIIVLLSAFMIDATIANNTTQDNSKKNNI